MYTLKQITSYGIVASCSMLIGFDSGYLNGVLGSVDFNQRFGATVDEGATWALTSTTRALFTSMLAVGTLAGAILTAFIPDRMGRRGALFTASAIYALGAILQVWAPNAGAFIAGRVLLGLALVTISIVSPAYLVEGSTAKSRGLLVVLFQQILTTGNVLACAINLGTEQLSGDKTWRITIGFQLVLALVVFAGSILAVESPRILLRRGKDHEAHVSVAAMTNLDKDSTEVIEHVAALKAELEKEAMIGEITYLQCFQGTDRRRTLLGVGMGWMTISTGITFWFGYGTTFFQAAGLTNAYLISLGLALINCAFTALSFIFIERLGRRMTLFLGSAIMGVTQLIAGILNTAMPGSYASQTALIVFAVLFIAAFASTWGPVGWVVMSEPFSARGRAKQQSITMFAYWTATWAVGFCTPYMVDPPKQGGAGLGVNITYFWAGIVILSTVWAYLCVPELRGLSQTQVDLLFDQRVPSWRSSTWKHTVVLDSESVPTEGNIALAEELSIDLPEKSKV